MIGLHPPLVYQKKLQEIPKHNFFSNCLMEEWLYQSRTAHHTAKKKEPVIFRSIATVMKVLLRKCFNGSAKMNLELVLESVIKHPLQVLKT